MDASYQVRFICSSGFRVEEFCRNRPISIKNCLWRPCLLRIEPKRTIFRGPSIYASYQVSILKKFIFRYQDLVEIYSVSAEKNISDAFSYSENVKDIFFVNV